MTAARNQNPDSRTPGVIGITVGGNIQPLRARFVDERHCFLRFSPNRNAAQLYVRNLNWKTRFPPDLNRFVQSIKCPISLIANVTDVDATERACSPGQSDHLVSRCGLSGFIFETARELSLIHISEPTRLLSISY